MPIYYHYTDEDGAKDIIRSGTMKASLKHMTRGDTAFGNGVYLTSLNPWTSSRDEIMMNNWGNRGTTEMKKTRRIFILNIPKTDIKKAENTERDIYLFGHGKDLRLHKYPWLLKCYLTGRILASYKYDVVARKCKFALRSNKQTTTLGPDKYEDYIGNYAMSDEIVNGSPVYESSKNCLFMGSDGNWYLGPDIKTPKIRQDCADFITNTILTFINTKESFTLASLGPDETGEWKFLGSDGVWTTDSLLQTRPCSFAVQPSISDCYLSDLHKQLTEIVDSTPGERRDAHDDTSAHRYSHWPMIDKAEDPAVQPSVWVTGWVDYRDKTGFGYALNDGSVGVVFNDFTKILLPAEGANILYINEREKEHYYTVNEFPADLQKKMMLLERFRNSAKENLIKTQKEYQLSRIPTLNSWLKTSRAIFMHLTNGTLQINFKDSTKLILCPLQKAVTYIDEAKKKRTFRFDLLRKYGCSPELRCRINLALYLRYDGKNGETKKKLEVPSFFDHL